MRKVFDTIETNKKSYGRRRIEYATIILMLSYLTVDYNLQPVKLHCIEDCCCKFSNLHCSLENYESLLRVLKISENLRLSETVDKKNQTFVIFIDLLHFLEKPKISRL